MLPLTSWAYWLGLITLATTEVVGYLITWATTEVVGYLITLATTEVVGYENPNLTWPGHGLWATTEVVGYESWATSLGLPSYGIPQRPP